MAFTVHTPAGITHFSRNGCCNKLRAKEEPAAKHKRKTNRTCGPEHHHSLVSRCVSDSQTYMKRAISRILGKMSSAFGIPQNELPVSKLEAKMVEAMQKRAIQGTSMISFNTIILKFPKIDKSLRKCKTTFEEFDEDSNGAIDQAELKRCFYKLEVSFTEEEIDDLFKACDINEDMGISFNEFIVLLCLVYLLHEPIDHEVKSKMGLQNIEATFEILVDTFVFLDKNKDGYVSKNEMIEAINESRSGERSSGWLGMKRFEEMDWDKNGSVTFKEFLFACIRWIGLDDHEDEDEEE